MSTDDKDHQFPRAYLKKGSWPRNVKIVSHNINRAGIFSSDLSCDDEIEGMVIQYKDRWLHKLDTNSANWQALIAASKAESKALQNDIERLDERLIEANAVLGTQKQNVIYRAPGYRAIGILQAVLPKSVFDRIYGQMVADARQEYFEAIAQGDLDEAKKIARYLNFSLISSVVEFLAGLPAHLLSLPFKAFKKEDE
ncbi:hypothetical protein PVA19_14660 [Agrobacterium sp. CNPSo 3708]|uniref:hypothetical protein n=1 Tax=unclassified Agrobacterium TaxID=2632611 RepID=UPI0023646A40|nr:hypothetical protein [Agrobacterium sp. CNPSo 3708]MDD1499662.1 hypothetical protein [Agrobacterium sp. CNPSo 3708]